MKRKKTEYPLVILGKLNKIKKEINGKEEYLRDWLSFYKKLMEIIELTEIRLSACIETEEMREIFLERAMKVKRWKKEAPRRFELFLKEYKINKEVIINE